MLVIFRFRDGRIACTNFAQGGVNPSAVNLIRDRFTGQSRGFAFVEITNDEEADRAVKLITARTRWTQSGG